MSDAIRSLLVEAQRDAYHAHEEQLERLKQFAWVPQELLNAVRNEQTLVFDELQKRIDALTVTPA